MLSQASRVQGGVRKDDAGNERVGRRLAAILAADIAGYSALMGANEVQTVQDLKSHQAVVLPMVGQFGGRIIDTAGDGILAEFASIVDAVECAASIQRVMAERNALVAPDRCMRFRIGINLGDVLHDEHRIFGDGINIAARLESIAVPGEICISEKVFEEVRDRLPISFFDWGQRRLKNIARSVRVYGSVPDTDPPAHAALVSSRNTPKLPEMPSLAILPFDNLSDDKEQEFLVDGLVEDVLTALSKLSSMFVVARQSSFAFKGKRADIRDVGRQLGVRYVLEGSVRRAGPRVRLTAQLIDSSDGKHIWAERYDRSLDDIFEIQDDLTKEIVTALRVQLTDGEQATMWLRSTSNIEAWGYATRGADCIWKGTAADMAQARELLEQAVFHDPVYAKAIALIGLTHYFDVRFGYTASKDESMRKMAGFAAAALAIDAEEPYAIHTQAMARSLEGRFDEAVGAMQLVVSRYPCHALFWLALARLLVNAERAEEGERAVRHAMRLNPFFPINYLAVLGDALVQQGQSHAALDVFDEIVRRQPNYISAYLHLVDLHCSMGAVDRARAAAAEILRIDPQYRVAAAASFFLSSDENRKRAFIDALRVAGLPD